MIEHDPETSFKCTFVRHLVVVAGCTGLVAGGSFAIEAGVAHDSATWLVGGIIAVAIGLALGIPAANRIRKQLNEFDNEE